MFYKRIQSCSFSLDLSMRVFMYHKSVAFCKAVKIWVDRSKYTFILVPALHGTVDLYNVTFG